MQQFHDTEAAPLFLAVAGSHLQGVAGPDSDLDLRGFHCLDGTQYLFLNDPDPQIRFTLAPPSETPEIEVVSHELRAFGRRLSQYHFNALEPLFAPTTVVHADSACLSMIQSAVLDALPGELPTRYRGMANSLYDEYIAPDAPKQGALTIKHLLYALRGTLAARYVHEEASIEPNLHRLSQRFLTDSEYTVVQRLVEARQSPVTDDLLEETRQPIGQVVQNQLADSESAQVSQFTREAYQSDIEDWMLSVREETTIGR